LPSNIWIVSPANAAYELRKSAAVASRVVRRGDEELMGEAPNQTYSQPEAKVK
jgi:hypothetical protein